MVAAHRFGRVRTAEHFLHHGVERRFFRLRMGLEMVGKKLKNFSYALSCLSDGRDIKPLRNQAYVIYIWK